MATYTSKFTPNANVPIDKGVLTNAAGKLKKTDIQTDKVNSVKKTDRSYADLFSDAFQWEPKYQHKFIMVVDDLPAFLIKSSAKPSAENGEIVLDHINIQRKVKGKTKWNNIEITLYDAIVPSAAQAVMHWFRHHHESALGKDGYSSQYKRNITLQQLSGTGVVIEEWTLNGAFINSCNWGTLDWSSEEVQTITATLSYDYAFMHF